jgi:hypothetical protein
MANYVLTLALDFWDTIEVFWESALSPGFGPTGVFEPAVANLPLQILSRNNVKESCQ